MKVASITRVWRRLCGDPRAVISLVLALARGIAVVMFYRLVKRRVVIRLPFYVYHGWVRISGPGSVFIDRGCLVDVSVFTALSITTLKPDARVIIGRKCRMAGAVIRCAHSVVLEEGVMTGYCLIQDQQMVSAGEHPAAPAEALARIRVGAGAWITRQAVLGPDTDIGAAAVVGIGSVCYKIAVPAHTVTVGSPVMRSVAISGVAAMSLGSSPTS